MLKHMYNRDTFLLAETGSIQDFLLDKYRLTDEFRTSYGNYMLSSKDNEKFVNKALAAIAAHKHVENADVNMFRTLVTDLLYTRFVLDFKHWEYFSYGLEYMPIEQRLEFVSESGRHKYTKVLNPDYAQNLAFSNKATTAALLSSLLKRDFVAVVTGLDWQSFKSFCAVHPRFLAKPIDGSLGSGVEVIDTTDYSDLRLHSVFNKYIGTKKGVLCEEIIDQDDRLKAMHSGSVNTVRATTYLGLDGSVKIVCAYLRTGRGGSVVDNAGAGGIYSAVDGDSGISMTDAVSEDGVRYERHPDTNFVFKGFEIPCWDDLKSVAFEAAKAVPGIRLIGWDMALSKDKGWQIVEGNCQPQFNVVQVALGHGIRDQFEKAIEWDANRYKYEHERKNNK